MIKINKRQLEKDVWGWLIASPLLIGLLVFTLYPLLKSLQYSFYDVHIGREDTLTNFGLSNYKEVLFGQYGKMEFWPSLGRTLKYAMIQVPMGLILGYLLATFLCAKVKGNAFLLVLYYLPTLIPSIISGTLWFDMFDGRFGFFNTVLSRMGLPTVRFMEAKNLMASYIWMTTFSLGGGSIIWVAGIQSVDNAYYEAAKIDGASKARMFFSITIPLTTPYIFYNLTMGVIGALQLFNGPLVLTGSLDGGDGHALKSVEMTIYQTAFARMDFGPASAMSWLLCLVIAFFTGLTFLSKKWVQYGDD